MTISRSLTVRAIVGDTDQDAVRKSKIAALARAGQPLDLTMAVEPDVLLILGDPSNNDRVAVRLLGWDEVVQFAPGQNVVVTITS